MNKGNHTIKRDENLREALRQDEASLPQMTADLNERLMKRLHPERRQRHFAVWPWVAAACVAATVAIMLLPSRESCDGAMTGTGELATRTCPHVNIQGAEDARERESPTTNEDCRTTSPDTHSSKMAKTTGRKPGLQANTPLLPAQPTSPVAKGHAEEYCETTQKCEEMLAQEKPTDMPIEQTERNGMASADLPQRQPKPHKVVLTERDIPISRPENYRYTPEEIALMRRQANEAYLKWMQLELEIAKYNSEQMVEF